MAAVYRHKTQEKDKFLTILYSNLSENSVILTPGEMIAHGLMCSAGRVNKPVLNAVKPNVNSKTVTDKLWKDQYCEGVLFYQI